jgi:two-component system OmpR family response regulator
MPRTSQDERLTFGEFDLDTARRALCHRGEDLHLAPKEYLVLASLVEQAGRAVSREHLMAEVWPGTAVGDTSLARCISSLRRHLGAEAIQAVPKFGYRFTLPVSVAPAPQPAVAEVATPLGGQTEPLSATTETTPLALSPTPERDRSFLRRWWPALAGVALVLLLGAVRGPLAPALRRQTATTWTDPQTGLMWQRQDNGVGAPAEQADMTRDAAAAYCYALRLGGRHDWRLPTIEELQTLHDPTQSAAGLWGGYRQVYWHIKGGITPSGGEVAADPTFLTDVTPAGEEQSYDFSFGRRNYDPMDFKADHRVLCVRSANSR